MFELKTRIMTKKNISKFFFKINFHNFSHQFTLQNVKIKVKNREKSFEKSELDLAIETVKFAKYLK